jgi:hypothetical protein
MSSAAKFTGVNYVIDIKEIIEKAVCFFNGMAIAQVSSKTPPFR